MHDVRNRFLKFMCAAWPLLASPLASAGGTVVLDSLDINVQISPASIGDVFVEIRAQQRRADLTGAGC